MFNVYGMDAVKIVTILLRLALSEVVGALFMYTIRMGFKCYFPPILKFFLGVSHSMVLDPKMSKKCSIILVRKV